MNAVPRSPTAPPRRRSAGRIELIILTGAAVVRIALLSCAESRPERFEFPDSRRYLKVARNFADGKGLIEAPNLRAGTDPVYPMILAAGIGLGAESDAAVYRFARIVNAAFSCITVIMGMRMARRLWGQRPAMFVGIVLALDPILLYFNALVLTETVFITLLLAAIACVVNGPQGRPVLRAACAGALLAVATLTRSTSLLIPLTLAPFVWSGVRAPDWRRRALPVAVMLASWAVVMLPWVVRNVRVFDRLVVVRTGGGASLLEAFGPWADGGPGMQRVQFPPVAPDADEVDRDRVYRAAAFQWIRQNPAAAVSLSLRKALRTWSPLLHAPDHTSAFYQAISVMTVVPIYFLAALGAWRQRRHRRLVALLLVPAAYFTLVHMVFVGSVRYRLPAVAAMICLAGAVFATRRRGPA
jgi:4-amino-4-deoxy-L-arabinose transferase-like glycosyltransferase